MKKKKKLARRSAGEKDKTVYRILTIRKNNGSPATLDEDTRSIEAVGATENPVEIFDWERGIINEVLLMDGLEMPSSRQIPLLDSHRRFAGVSSVLGSYREMQAEKDQLAGRVHFSSVPEAEGPYIKVKEGHLTDFSVGYRQISSEWVPENEKRKIKGRSFEGPVLVTTRWRAKELSIVPIGSDELAKARQDAEKQQTNQEDQVMKEQIRKFLESKGLPKDATEDEALRFLENLDVPKKEVDNETDNKTKTGDDGRKVVEQAIVAERERISEIRAMCKSFECSDLSDQLIADGKTVDQAREKVMEYLKLRKEDNDQVGIRTPISIVADERDKFRDAATDALLIRSGSLFVPEKPAMGADDLTGYSLRELARHALYMAGQSQKGDPRKMVGRALKTSDLPYILANVANKALFLGFETNDETWQVWCDAGSVSDFKTHYSPRISESDDLEEVPESGEYQYGSRSEAQEQYSIATFGKIFAITRQAIINDDLGALTRIPQSHGEAAARKIGDVVYAVLTANAAMGDAVALFHADHSNFVAHGSGAAPGKATIAAGILAMGTQKDIKGLRRLNIRPEFFIGPKALEGDTEVFFRSEFYSDEAAIGTPDAAVSTTRKNPYSGDYFTRVWEPRLDDNDALAWFLAARKSKTVTTFFLNGQQTPYLETKDGWTVDGVEYKVRIDCGAKAMDYRGLYMNDGN